MGSRRVLLVAVVGMAMARVTDLRAGEDAEPQPFAAPVAVDADPFATQPGDDPFAAAVGSKDQSVEELQELSLEQLLTTVVTATKVEENLYDSPAIVTVVTGDEMRRWGYQSLDEVLRHIVGFYVIDDQMTPNVAVRGVSGGLRGESSILKVMVDGQAIDFRSTSGNWLGGASVPLTAVERVEIIRGPASALYGADAFLGVINVITYGADELGGGRLSISGASINGRPGVDQDLAIGAKKGPLELFAATRLRYQDLGSLELPDSSPAASVPAWRKGDRQARGQTDYDGVGLLKLAYVVSKRTAVRFTGYASMLDHGGEFADWYQLAHGRDEGGRFSENRVSLAQGVVRLALTTGVGADVDLEVSGSWFRGTPTSRDRIEVGSDIFFERRHFGFEGGEGHASATWCLLPELTLVGGIDGAVDDEEPLTVEHVLKSSPAFQLNGGRSAVAGESVRATERLVNTGLFGQAIWKPWGKLLGVTAGLRYDWHSIYGNELSGRVAVVSSPLAELHLKLMAGNAFKAPTPLQLWAVPYAAGDIIGNANLKAQHVATIEGQVIYEAFKAITAKAGVTYSRLTDQAEFTPQGVNQVAANVAQVGSLSFEGELSARYRDRVTSYLNAAYNYTVDNTGEEGYRANLIGHANTLYPKVIVNGGVRGVVPRLPIEGNVEVSWVSARRASSDNILENVGDYSLDAYVLVGASVALVGELFMIGKSTRLMLVGKNLSGALGPDPGFGGIDYPLVGRTILLQFSQEL